MPPLDKTYILTRWVEKIIPVKLVKFYIVGSARIVNSLTLALLDNFLAYHVYILAYLSRV